MSIAKARIFIVEDSSVVALDLQRSLQNMGYHVMGVFSSGEEAIEVIPTLPADLIMMDIHLKGKLDGVETAAIIRSKVDIPVIYLTAYSDQETLERAKITDPFGYIIKPFEIRELNTAIEMALYKHKMEYKLRESEKWLSTTLQSIGDAVIAIDKAGLVIFLNPVAERLTGWDHQSAYRRPLTEVFHIINEATGEALKNPVAKIFEHGTTVRLVDHTLLINRYGQKIPIDNNAAPIRDKNGQIAGVVLVFRDITERRKQEQVLEQSESRYRAVVEQAVEGIYLVDFEKKQVIEANQAFADLLGYHMDEIVGIPVYHLLNHKEAGVDKRIFRLVNRREPMIEERQYLAKDGTVVDVRVSASLISYQGREVLCTVVHDISERKKAEKALQESETRFRVLANAIPDLMIRITKDGTVLDSKPAVDFISPLASAEHGKNILSFLEPELKVNLLQAIERSLQSQEIQIIEYLITVKGDVRDHETRVVPMSDNEVLLIARDITERKRMERQLKYLSVHDSLTGIYNRTYFEEEIRRIESMRQGKVGLIISDLDGLKLVNDTLGHKHGDALLMAASQIIKAAIRPEDFVARIGGDEFAVLLDDIDSSQIEHICRRMRKQVDMYNQEHPELPLSISFGFAVKNSEQVNMQTVFKEADDNMYREKLYRSKSARSTIVQAMMKVLEVKDFITEGHANRMHDLIVKLAQALNLSEPIVTNLRLLAQFHDIGKVGTPDRVLFKPGELDPKEKIEIQRHSEIGHRIAKSIPELEPISDWILKHHEWWNGNGYPLGLKGEAIPLESRILAIADAYDAMTSDRPYRKALTHDEAISEIKRCSGKQFDPALVEQFIQILK